MCQLPKLHTEPDGRVWCIQCGMGFPTCVPVEHGAPMPPVTSEGKVPPRSAGDLRDAFNLITQQELAFMLNVTEPTIRVWRHENRGPDFVKFGKQVFYTRDAVERWLQSSTVQLVPRANRRVPR